MTKTGIVYELAGGLSDEALFAAVSESVASFGGNIKKALILPPDYTRLYSGGGKLTRMYYELLSPYAEVDIMPALGTHVPMTEAEWVSFFGKDVPFSRMLVHNWRTDVVKIGEVPAEYVTEISEGLVNEAIPVEINRRLLDPSYDVIISVGQVVPHEVVGMANYSKNIFVGCGGSRMINASHMLGAFYGMERVMGRDFSPVRKVFDYAETRFISELPLVYALTVATGSEGVTNIHGIYIGRERALFEKAVALSSELNFITVSEPLKKCVVYLDPAEFKSTWLGNKAIYRTRMAMADGGELIILAPGVSRFGEDNENDRLIRKYGYCGRKKVLELVKTEEELKNNLSVAAHLIHGSSDGRFSVTYCTNEALPASEINAACFGHIPYAEASAVYNPEALKDGFNTVGGEEIYYISNPALGLWRSGEASRKGTE